MDTMLPFAWLGALVVVVPLLYSYTASVAQTRFPTLRNKRICLLIAHPDDEAMFFAPTLLALTKPELGNHVKILCLSTGNADGLGETRKKELVKSAMLLGLRQEDDVFVLDSPDFQDSMAHMWDIQKISNLLASAFAPSLLRPNSPSSQTPTASIDVLLTFDASGISGHANHRSLYHGARDFLGALTKGRSGFAAPVDLYTLKTVNIVRKYSGFLDALGTTLDLTLAGGNIRRKSDKGNPGAIVSMSSLWGSRESAGAARKAMTEAHLSQMVWFRWGYIVLSRYMMINDLRLERVK